MAEIILHPTHPDYCRECIYDDVKFGAGKNEAYKENGYYVNCIWHYCKFKKVRKKNETD